MSASPELPLGAGVLAIVRQVRHYAPVARDDETVRARRREAARAAQRPDHCAFWMGPARVLGSHAVAAVFGAVLLAVGPSSARRIFGLALLVIGGALLAPAWRWYQRRWAELDDPPRLRDELALTTVDLLAIAFVFAACGLVALANQAWIGGAALLCAGAATALYARR